MVPDQPAGSQTLCGTCHTDEYLVYEHIRAVKNPSEGVPSLWDVDCWCGKCETFYGFTGARPPRDPHQEQPPHSELSA